jgi:diguanylate cyclase (GGDEF)-like protein
LVSNTVDLPQGNLSSTSLPREKWRVGLRAKFLLSSMIFTVFGVAVTAINIRQDQEVIEARLREKARSTVTVLAENAVDPMALLDMQALGLVLRSVRALPEVVYILAFDSQGRILSNGSGVNPHRHKVLNDPISFAAARSVGILMQTDGDTLDVSHGVYLGDQRLGGVRIGFSLKELRGQVHASRTQNLLFGLGFILVGVLLTWRLTHTITRPIDNLIQGTRAVAGGALDTRIDIRTNDELQVLATAFNHMTENLRTTREKLLHDAIHDPLTSLPNRMLFMDRLRSALSRATRQGHFVAVLFLDVDGFKLINDSFGHGTGDGFLQVLARRLRTNVRAPDTVARLGGDEFTVLLEDLRAPQEAVFIAEQLLGSFEHSFTLGGHEVFATASIGIAVSSGESTDPSDLVRDADIAMYRAKVAGKARYEVFDEGMHRQARRILEIQTHLRHAASRGELSLVYQPIVTMASREIVGFEALLRWKHPVLGQVPPAEFIPVAENTGFIVPIGEWALWEACQQTARWRREVASLDDMTISVNLSRQQLTHPDFVQHVRHALREAKLPPSDLTLEITETTMMEQPDKVARVLEEIRAMKVRIAMDDFGTGYSSLSLLHRFPIQILKLDSSFVRNLTLQSANSGILRAILTLAQTTQMDVVAEGIETETEASLLRSMQCRYGQGYLFGSPVNAEQTNAFLQRFGTGESVRVSQGDTESSRPA